MGCDDDGGSLRRRGRVRRPPLAGLLSDLSRRSLSRRFSYPGVLVAPCSPCAVPGSFSPFDLAFEADVPSPLQHTASALTGNLNRPAGAWLGSSRHAFFDDVGRTASSADELSLHLLADHREALYRCSPCRSFDPRRWNYAFLAGRWSRARWGTC